MSWGPLVWHAITTLVECYPENPSQRTQNECFVFFKSLASMLPCPGKCQPHYRALLEEHPPEVQNVKALITWFNKIHNLVNERLGKENVTIADEMQKFSDKAAAVTSIVHYATAEEVNEVQQHKKGSLVVGGADFFPMLKEEVKTYFNNPENYGSIIVTTVLLFFMLSLIIVYRKISY